jgi:hypothetical protein
MPSIDTSSIKTSASTISSSAVGRDRSLSGDVAGGDDAVAGDSTLESVWVGTANPPL